MLTAMVNEIRNETVATKRLLERVPEDKLSWKPHPKAMSLGQLAFHVAVIPKAISQLSQLPGFDASQANFEPPHPSSVSEILGTLDSSIAAAEEYLSGVSDTSATETWRLTSKGKEVFAIPRVEMLRSIMLNHWYHHRGQLSVYLRILEVPIPVIYGRSADEDPFA